MTHEDHFLRAILAAPDDDAPRLLYADWLEERGDPRGEFIRVQCALARMDSTDSGRPDLEDEERALREHHEAEWMAPLPGITAWRFRRGFVEEVALSTAALLAHGANLFTSFPIRKVSIRPGAQDMEALKAGRVLAQVRELDLSGSHLRDRGVEALLGALHPDRLTALELRGNGLENQFVRTLAASPLMRRLTRLDLSGNHAVGLAAARALAQAPAPALRFLGLSSTNIGLVGLRDLLYSSTLTALTSLQAARIGYYGVGGAPGADLADAPGLSRLTNLDLSGFAATSALVFLLRSPRLRNLTSLDLAICGLRDVGARALANSPDLRTLTALDLRQNAIGPDGAEALAASPHLEGLTTLHLGSNAIRDKGARALIESPHFTRLAVLDFSHNGIGGPGLRALVDSPHTDALTALDLSDNYVGAESIQALAASPRLARLASLRLNNNRLGPAAVRALAASPHLGRLAVLHLNNTALDDKGLHALLHAPHLTRLQELSVRLNTIGSAGADALAALLEQSPRWPRLRKLDLTGNPLSGPEQRQLQQRFGARVEL